VSAVGLRGITWDHPRGRNPCSATAEAWQSIEQDVQVHWSARSLHDFGASPVDKLAEHWDLLVIDHPFVGAAARARCLAPMGDLLPETKLTELRSASVGPAYDSYVYDGQLWALPIDVAGHVSVCRPDLLDRVGATEPETWGEVLDLAAGLAVRGGPRVALPLTPVDVAMAFISLCANAGTRPFASGPQVVDRETGLRALEVINRLARLGPADAATMNPIGLLDRMVGTDDVVYSPLLFGYVTYSGAAAGRNLRFGPIAAGPAGRTGGVLGGAGLAVSARCEQAEAAARYAEFVASLRVQKGLYVSSGGQPADRRAWLDPGVNASTGHFFSRTLASLDASYLRPRYDGFAGLQETAGQLLRSCVLGVTDPETALDELDRLHRSNGDPDSRQ
jgi:multiple sugar transport system substrate-binding protein